jgi:hypothetical protein
LGSSISSQAGKHPKRKKSNGVLVKIFNFGTGFIKILQYWQIGKSTESGAFLFE